MICNSNSNVSELSRILQWCTIMAEWWQQDQPNINHLSVSISCQQNVYFSDFLFHNKNNAYFLLHDAISKDTANDDEVSEEDMKQMEGTTMCESGVAVYRLCQSCSLRELVFLKVFESVPTIFYTTYKGKRLSTREPYDLPALSKGNTMTSN